MAAGKPASAVPRLTRLADRWPGNGEVHYDLGVCELALGHADRAAAAWAQVPPGSPLAARAAMMRARQALKVHRLSAAEPLLPAALDDPGDFGKEARETLVHLYKLQGRFDEARRLVREGWGRYDRVGTIQELSDSIPPIPFPSRGPCPFSRQRHKPLRMTTASGWAGPPGDETGPIRRGTALA